MWHEARKQEKKIRGLMVDYKRRAERRREFYEKIRRDPAQFLQIHGNKMKIHLDATITDAAESCLMPWRGEKSNMIDRFDVRAHLDSIDTEIYNESTQHHQTVDDESSANNEFDRKVNYERWRNLVQNEYLAVSESKALHQIWLEERFGTASASSSSMNVENQALKKKMAEKKAAIGYNYDRDDEETEVINNRKEGSSSSSEDESDLDNDYDTSVNIETLTYEQSIRLSTISLKYGLRDKDFVRFLEDDKEEAERIRIAKEIENEKSMFSGRKSRRERRALKERRMLILRANNSDQTANLAINAGESNQICNDDQSSDSSTSDHVDESKIEFITCFGGSSEDEQETKKDTIKDEPLDKQLVNRKSTKRRKNKSLSSANKDDKNVPIEFGPSLPPSYTINFNSVSNKSRNYRYRNDDHHRSKDKNRSRSRSRSFSHSKVYGTSSRNDRSSSRSRYRPDRRSRSRSRSRQIKRYNDSRRRNARSRSRTSSRNRRSGRSRSRDHSRRNRSCSRHRSRRNHSRSKRDRSKSRSRSRTRRDGYSSKRRSRSKSREKDSKKNSVIDKPDHQQVTKKSPALNREMLYGSIKIEKVDQPSKEEKLSPIQLNQIPLPELPKVELPEKNVDIVVSIPSPPIKRYYRHDLASENDQSDDNEDNQDANEKMNDAFNKSAAVKNVANAENVATLKVENDQIAINNKDTLLATTTGSSTNLSTAKGLKPQERLRKKMQSLIDKQYKLDKKAEREKMEKEEQERFDRDEELKELNNRYRYRYKGDYQRSFSRSRSRSRSYSPVRRRRRRSRSYSSSS